MVISGKPVVILGCYLNRPCVPNIQLFVVDAHTGRPRKWPTMGNEKHKGETANLTTTSIG